MVTGLFIFIKKLLTIFSDFINEIRFIKSLIYTIKPL